jgi:arylsulfatase A-like enzyme
LVDTSKRLPDVILIGLDTVRADHLGCYGNDWIETPNLDRFAESSILFEDCMSTSSWTLPSFASIFTGLMPDRHGAVGGPHKVLRTEVPTMAEFLDKAGYETMGFVGVDYLGPNFDMNRGFGRQDRFVAGDVTGRSRKYQYRILRQIGLHHERPLFLFAHYFDAHDPYTAPAPFHRMYYDGDPEVKPQDPARDISVIYSQSNHISMDPEKRYEWLSGVKDLRYPVKEYAAGISYLDSEVGAVLDSLEGSGAYDRSIVVVVADHGEHLTEHGVYLTHRFPYAEVSHVPLMIRLPGGVHGGQRVSEPVSIADVLPTLLELLGISAPDDLDGESLVAAMRGHADPERVLYAEYGGRERNKVKAVWNADYRYLEFNIKGRWWNELYDRRKDPRETKNLVDQDPEHARIFSDLLTRRFGAERHILMEERAADQPLDPEVEARLRALGYVH